MVMAGPTYYVSARQEERSGGRGIAAVHLSMECASPFYGDAGPCGIGGPVRFCQRCASTKQRTKAERGEVVRP